jgi:rifampicin phosphotransferase
MARYVLDLQQIDPTRIGLVGGKGANLAELSRIPGVDVPPGYCVTTEAFERMLSEAAPIDDLLSRLSGLAPDDRETIHLLADEVRGAIEAVALPHDLSAAITRPLAGLGEHSAYAVRSSATTEDLAGSSFAGQHDTYLNVTGAPAIVEHVRRCWVSLYSDRAIIYRLQNGPGRLEAQMAVVVQQMVLPRAAGILFTADPVTSNRKVSCVEATSGLGEALVSGLVNADVYEVREGEVLVRAIASEQLVRRPSPSADAKEPTLEPQRRREPVLTDTETVRLEQLGRRIEAHFGRPQDIEWCLAEDGLSIVQSRPITTLFPIPAADDGENHVYVSVGHQQMMTDAMKPLGLSVWLLSTPRPMCEAAGRLFVDVTRQLASPVTRGGLVEVLGRSDPLIGDALRTLLEREDFIRALPDGEPAAMPPGVMPSVDNDPEIETDPAIVAELVARSESSVAALKRAIGTKSGVALFDFILEDIQELRRILFDPESLHTITATMRASWWLNEHLGAWLGETNVADTLTRSAPHNVTAEMGLALLDVADVVRPHPEVVAFLGQVEDDGFLEELPSLVGGREVRDAIESFLDRYGMRCAGEIDITRPRWSERPTMLLPTILGHVKNRQPGAAARRVEDGRAAADEKERELLRRVLSLPEGARKARETGHMIDRVRTFTGYREYPKYGMVSRYFLYKRALLREAARLVESDVIDDSEDIFYLTLQELHDGVRTNRVDRELIRRRREAFHSFGKLSPPRVMTSDGEVVTGTYRREDLPAGALPALPVSAGTVEGRGRVILDMARAEVEPGDILVTAYTDPSWTPLFVAVGGLVTEAGGLMTHGAVIAREYGLPAVVGVEGATRLIRDGQMIRVDGTRGYVELLD